MRKVLTGAFLLSVVAAASLVIAAAASAAKQVEPHSFCLGNQILYWDVEASEPLVRDTITFYGTGALVQHSIIVERVFNPASMRGAVSGSISGSGPSNHRGMIHGVITPEGMSGTITMTRFREDGATDKFVGRWTASGHPVDFSSSYLFCFEGHFIVST